MVIFVTGAAGFIGSNFVLNFLNGNKNSDTIISIDKLTYAGSLKNLDDIKDDPNHHFIHGDILDEKLIRDTLKEYKPSHIINFAAESHVDNSIAGPDEFINTNIVGTYNLLKCSYKYYKNLNQHEKKLFRFVHISTDEVYGSLGPKDPEFTEESNFRPNSPYSASKASSDHLVRAWNKTYGFPTITSNCSNNFGPRQFPEKLIPLVINNILNEKSIPVYGSGKQIRDWLFVKDHCDAIMMMVEKGIPGETYNIGGKNEIMNIDLVNRICNIMDEIIPSSKFKTYKDLILHVEDRPGHDERYAINSNKIEINLGWTPKYNFEKGLLETIRWYLDNKDWTKSIISKKHSD